MTRGLRPVRSGALVATIATIVMGIAVAGHGSAALGAGRTPMSTNLVRNGGAEAGPASYPEAVVGKVPYWRRTGSFTVTQYGILGFLPLRESTRIGGGRQYFACGFLSDVGLARQRIRLRRIGRDVDAGRIRATLRAHIAAPDAGGDRGRLLVRFLGDDLREISSRRSRWVAGTTRRYVTRRVSQALPRRTRYLEVILRGERATGLYCNVFFDRVDLRLSRA